MKKKNKTSISNYELWNKIGTGIIYFFVALGFIFALNSSTMNEAHVIICLVLSFIGGLIVLYNDYRFQKYAKIIERLIAVLAVLVLTLVYWHLQ
jgi:hypothetical protein